MTATQSTPTNPTRRLVRQGENRRPTACGVYHGLSLTEVTSEAGVRYEMVVHARTYDGVRVSSKWDSEVLCLTATTEAEAVEECKEGFRTLLRSMLGFGEEEGRS